MDHGQHLQSGNDRILGERFVLDEQMFEKTFRQYFERLCAFCKYKYQLDEDTAKELVHASFVRLWQNRSFCSSQSTIVSYLFKILVNQCLDYFKHHAVRKKYEQHLSNAIEADQMQDQFESMDIKQLQSEINTAISELPEQMQMIFSLSRFEGLKYAEIAQQLNISVKTVETQMSRALIKLRIRLKDYLIVLLFTLLKNIFFFFVGVSSFLIV